MSGYEGTCLNDVPIEHDDQTVTLTLHKTDKRTVRLLAEHEIGPGRVFEVLDGAVIGYGAIDRDNTTLLDPHVPSNAVLYIAAVNYPLTRVSPPDFSLDHPLIVLPQSPGRAFTVNLSARSPHNGGPLGLIMYGVPTPGRILQYHQAIHHFPPPQIRRGETVQFAAVDSSSSPALLLWHWVADLPKNLLFADPFGTPAALGLMYRMPVTGTAMVLDPDR